MAGDPYAHLAASFVDHYATLRGALRYALVAGQLDEQLSTAGTLEIVDVGGGAGHQAVRLARQGHAVTLVDPSQEMLHRARIALDSEDGDVRSRVRLVEAPAAGTSDAVDGQRFQAVLCHAVLPYVEDPQALIRSLAELAEPGALLSLVYKNSDALAMRPALEGRWSDAARAFDAVSDVGGLGVETRSHRRSDVAAWTAGAGFALREWYGIRVMSDHLREAPAELLEAVLPVEAHASRRDPYRALGRLIHAVYTYAP
jgi:S-adenosylmethionine-dependent methyltransferase